MPRRSTLGERAGLHRVLIWVHPPERGLLDRNRQEADTHDNRGGDDARQQQHEARSTAAPPRPPSSPQARRPGTNEPADSDGITEAQSTTEAFFNEAGILDIVGRHAGSEPLELAKAICAAAEAFERGNQSVGDDKTVVVVRVGGGH